MARSFLVTGCASGIGRHLAGELVRRGEHVVATDIDIEALKEHADAELWSSNSTRTLALDVTDSGAWERVVADAVEAFGPIDVLVNVAGFLKPGWVHEVEPEAVHRHFDINLKGVVFGTSIVSRRMVERGDGHIINIASLAALAPVPGIALYSASKYGVRAFSLAAAQELRRHGVRVSIVCPDAVQTPMLDLQRDYEQAALTFSGPRVLEVEDITKAIFERVLPDRPLELFIPPHRGWLARLADVFPRTAFTVGPLLERRGRARQKRR